MSSVTGRGDPSPPRSARRRWRLSAPAVFVVGVLALSAVVAGAAFQVTHSSETASGTQNAADFLTHFPTVGTAFTATPLPVPALLSSTAGAPTLLPAAAASWMLNTGVAGHEAWDWGFSETVGIATSTEIELRFQVTYEVGATTLSYSATAYVETQAAAIGANLAFTVYWDGGATTGVTVLSQLEISQVCGSVGACP